MSWDQDWDSSQTVLDVALALLARNTGNKSCELQKEDTKLSVFIDDMTVYLEKKKKSLESVRIIK